MKPFKAGQGLGIWLMRISLTAVLLFKFVPTVLNLGLDHFYFYIALIISLFAVMLFIGAFLNKATLTVVSALVINIPLIYLLIIQLKGGLNEIVFIYLMFISIAMYFLTRGNK